jgi:MazG family protein
MDKTHDLDWLSGIVRRLLAPGGCPWDREQTLSSLRPFLLEETCEVIDAIDEGDRDHHREELGDLLFQIVFQAELAGHPLPEVIRSIGDKLVRRHPHVFGSAEVSSTEEVRLNWEQIKDRERGGPRGALSGVPHAMPALPRATRLSTRAARVGFDWPDVASVRCKVMEEIDEVDEAASTGDGAAVEHELGDLLFAVANWARKLGHDPETALQRANNRFVQRFGHVEAELARRGSSPAGSSLDEMEALWQAGKEKPGNKK